MTRLMPLLVLGLAIAFAASPFLTPGFNGFEPDQFPVPQDDPPGQPAGYAFSIWGLIYLALIAGAAYGLIKRAEATGWQPMRPFLALSLAVGTTWLAVAQASPLWATLLIWVMLITALMALMRAGTIDRLWLRTPIALYAGWLTAASCVSVALVLAGYGFLGETAAALVALSLALVIAAGVQTLRPDTPEYAGAVIWALAAVIVANTNPLNLPVAGLAAAGIVALAVIAVKGARQS